MNHLVPIAIAACLLGCAAPPATDARSVTILAGPHSLALAAPARPIAATPSVPPPAVEIEEDWMNAVLHCDGREACARAAARVPPAERHIAANARARANGADDGCLAEATMAAALDDAIDECRKAARFAASDEDRRLILATPAKAAAAWRRYEARLRGGG